MEEMETKNLLIETYQNTSTAMQSIVNCIDDIKCEELVNELKEEMNQLKNINDEVESLAKKYNLNLQDINILEKAKLFTSIKMSTVFDKSTRHYAEMFFLGNNMGIYNMICVICDNKNAENDVKNVAEKLLSYEENYAIEMKKYFCKNCN